MAQHITLSVEIDKAASDRLSEANNRLRKAHEELQDASIEFLQATRDMVNSLNLGPTADEKKPFVCSPHNPVQHRDGKPPWCNNCGLTSDFQDPKGDLDG